MTGLVSLVGVGPGDPELLTLKALRRLEEADVVAYDELVSPAILGLAPAHALQIPVGRRAGGVRHHDAELHPAVLRHAAEGRRVVRLKGGDPLIFGRGGEEGRALARHGIPFELVPGVSAALGAASSACLPLTFRKVARTVTFATAHGAEGEALDALVREWPRAGTLCVYMGLGAATELRRACLEVGFDPALPAALVSNATREDEHVEVGTLDTLPALATAPGVRAPALLVLGEVVALRDALLAPVTASPSVSSIFARPRARARARRSALR